MQGGYQPAPGTTTVVSTGGYQPPGNTTVVVVQQDPRWGGRGYWRGSNVNYPRVGCFVLSLPMIIGMGVIGAFFTLGGISSLITGLTLVFGIIELIIGLGLIAGAIALGRAAKKKQLLQNNPGRVINPSPMPSRTASPVPPQPTGAYGPPQPTGAYGPPQPTGAYGPPQPTGAYGPPQPIGAYGPPQPTGTYPYSPTGQTTGFLSPETAVPPPYSPAPPSPHQYQTPLLSGGEKTYPPPNTNASAPGGSSMPPGIEYSPPPAYAPGSTASKQKFSSAQLFRL